MFAILVTEPGAEVSQYLLSRAGRTLDTAMRLMSEAAEEWISEELEVNGGEAEDYNVVTDIPGCVQVVASRPGAPAEPALISFEAAAITSVV